MRAPEIGEKVHVYRNLNVKGTVSTATMAEGTKVSYRPYQCGHFFTPAGSPVHTSPLVAFTKDGRAITKLNLLAA